MFWGTSHGCIVESSPYISPPTTALNGAGETDPALSKGRFAGSHTSWELDIAAMFNGAFDDSGDQDDPQHNCASFGGYIGPVDAWERFEIEWQRVLDAFGVPYLHMREFKNPKGHYAHLLTDRDKMAEFL